MTFLSLRLQFLIPAWSLIHGYQTLPVRCRTELHVPPPLHIYPRDCFHSLMLSFLYFTNTTIYTHCIPSSSTLSLLTLPTLDEPGFQHYSYFCFRTVCKRPFPFTAISPFPFLARHSHLGSSLIRFQRPIQSARPPLPRNSNVCVLRNVLLSLL